MSKAHEHTPEQRALLKECAAAARALETAQRRLDATREKRNAAIVAAIDAGVSPYFAAKAAGKSHTLAYHLHRDRTNGT